VPVYQTQQLLVAPDDPQDHRGKDFASEQADGSPRPGQRVRASTSEYGILENGWTQDHHRPGIHVRKITSAQKWDRILALVAFIILVCAWFAGTFRAQADVQPFLKQALPEADHFTLGPGGNFAAWKDAKGEELIGYIAVGSGQGYGGDLHLAVALALDGSIEGLVVVDHKETTAFFGRVLRRGVLDDLKGKNYSDPFILNQDVDSVSGATYSVSCLLYTSPSPRDATLPRMPSSA